VESAIPAHLRTARSRTRRIPSDYAPPYPSFVARHKPSVKRVVMAYFGLQYKGEMPQAARDALRGKRAALLMPREDCSQAVGEAGERLVERHAGPAGVGKDRVDAVVDQ